MRTRVDRRSRWLVAGALVFTLAATALGWWGWSRPLTGGGRGPAHVISQQTHSGYTCSIGTSQEHQSVEVGSVTPKHAVDLTGIRLIDPVNLLLVDAALVPQQPTDKPAVVAAPPPTFRTSYEASGDRDWSRAIDPEHGHLPGKSTVAVLVSIQVPKVTASASFADVELDYDYRGEHYTERLGQHLVLKPSGQRCSAR